ncbi:MAG: permease-like cell division protein FtsX [Elusimicrobia bacterium]|nr:permease-like cell division protein FtsX [Elusimicrobiota bacterium]
MWTTTKHIARYGLISFIRNGLTSLAAVLVMTITLSAMATTFLSGAALSALLSQLKNNVDVTVRFTANATKGQMSQLRKSLQALPEVASVTFESRGQALERFRKRHANDKPALRALQQPGGNPLVASLEIRAKQPSQCEAIVKYVSDQQANNPAVGPAIDTINFYRNKAAIDRLTSTINRLRALGFGIALVLGIASLLIAFNTIRIAICKARDEISAMELAGASRWRVCGPFVAVGMLYGIVSGLTVLILLYAVGLWLGPDNKALFGTLGVSLRSASSFRSFLLAAIGSCVALGALSSYLAVRRHLRS